jgi:uncharacterized protein (TIGR02300 family)
LKAFPVAKPDLGTKRICPTTGKKFYDMNRDPVVSPYTGEALPRSAFEPYAKGAAPAAAAAPRAGQQEEEPEIETAGPELVSLEDVEAAENKDAVEDEADLAEEGAADDTFLEEEEEAGDDVADLIDGDIEDDEEA